MSPAHPSGTVSWRRRPERDACICGIGARTPLGLDAPSSAAAVRAALSAIEAHPFMIDQAGEPMCVARDARLDAASPIGERMAAMLACAVAEAGGCVPGSDALRGLIAVPAPRPGLPDGVGQQLAAAAAAALGIDPARVAVVAHGHAGGLVALQRAARDVSEGTCGACVVAGVDSYLAADTLEWLDAQGLLLSARNRNGFVPGEGAGACLVVARGLAERRRLPILATLAGAASAVEPHPVRSGRVCVGEGLTAAVRAAIGPPRGHAARISATYCDLNGERYRTEEFVYTLLRTQEAFVDAHAYEAPADAWGDQGAASGLLQAVLAVSAYRRGYAKGRLPLLWAGSDGGLRAAVVLALGDAAGGAP